MHTFRSSNKAGVSIATLATATVRRALRALNSRSVRTWLLHAGAHTCMQFASFNTHACCHAVGVCICHATMTIGHIARKPGAKARRARSQEHYPYLSTRGGRRRRRHCSWRRWSWRSGTSSGYHTATGTKRVPQVIDVLGAKGAIHEHLRTAACCCGCALRLLLGRCRCVRHVVRTCGSSTTWQWSGR